MLWFKQSGRLGNQIFQYSALKTLARDNELLVLLGFDELEKVFDGIEAVTFNSSSSKPERFLARQMYELLQWLVHKKIVAYSVEDAESKEYPGILHKKMLLSGIRLVGESYFQCESLFSPQVVSSLKIKGQLQKYADMFIKQHAGDKPCFFVHVRQGDYQVWPSKENPAVLPLEYYFRCIHQISSEFSNPFFIFTSDDPFYIESNFSEIKNSVVSKNSPSEDFAIMTKCIGGVLSASSFAWWAAYFGKVSYPNGCFLAPKYWVGHSAKTWHPKFIETSFLKYVDVMPNSSNLQLPEISCK